MKTKKFICERCERVRDGKDIGFVRFGEKRDSYFCKDCLHRPFRPDRHEDPSDPKED